MSVKEEFVANNGKIKNYDFIDLLKFVASLLILTMHFNAFTSLNENFQFYGIELLARGFGVPFFFTISAFFLFNRSNGCNITKDKVVNYTKRIFILYITWFILNIPYVLFILYSRGIFNASTWLIFFRDAIISSTYMGSWYLMSCIFSAWAIYLMSKKMSNVYIFFISLAVYLLCIITSTYSKFLPSEVSLFIDNYIGGTSTTIFCGLFFFAVGKIVAENVEKLTKIPILICVVVFMFFYILFYLEMYILKTTEMFVSSDASVCLIPVAFFLVVTALKLNIKIKGSKMLRKMSTIIYCCQATLITVSRFTTIYLLGTNNTCISYMIGLIGLIIVCSLVLILDSKTKLKVIKFLY